MVLGGREQQDALLGRKVTKMRERRRLSAVGELGEVALSELGETLRIMSVPFSQLGRGSNLSAPLIKACTIL
jgi:hypothetical protein